MKMKKVAVGVLLLISMCLSCVDIGQTQTTVPLSVTFPSGSFGVTITKVLANPPYNGTTDTWPASGTPSESSISFGTLTELRDPVTNAPLGVFGPSDRRYYALDLAFTGGGMPASVSVSVSWTGADATTIGPKISATYKEMTFVTGGNPTESTIAGPQPISQSIGPFGIAYFTGHWVRMYVGIYVPPATGTGPAGLQPFTATDVARSYSASLVITAV